MTASGDGAGREDGGGWRWSGVPPDDLPGRPETFLADERGFSPLRWTPAVLRRFARPRPKLPSAMPILGNPLKKPVQ